MADRTVKMRGAVLALTGPELQVGDDAPNFKLQQRSPSGLKEVTLDDYAGKTLLISVVLSLDTPVCETQTKRYNEEAASLPTDIEILTVSMDLPFAQSRFSTNKYINHVSFASDHRDGSFGKAYGTLIESLRLETRALFVVGLDRKLRFVQYVPEITDEPDYYGALAAAREPQD